MRWMILPLVAALSLGGCQRRDRLTTEPAADTTERTPRARSTRESAGSNAARRAQASRRPPAGATCSGRDDCTSDQVCVDQRCRYRETSVAGEVLASAAEAQGAAGDWAGAIESYDAAFAEFERAEAPVPPEIACGAAELILRTATDTPARDNGARRADLCFRTTVPGHPARIAVRTALARLRFEGLEIAKFDEDEPQERFFTQRQSRPTVDTVAVQFEVPDLEPRELPGHTVVRDRLATDEGKRAIAECFIQDWETNHDRTASANLRMRVVNRVVDMGDHDETGSNLEVAGTSTAVDGFEPCLVAALPGLVDLDNRAFRRGDTWEQVIRITARIQ